MAQVPELNSPRVSPSAQAQSFQQTQAPPEAFGANVASQALTDLGQVAEQHSANLEQYALQYQALNNKVAADTSTTDAVGQIDTLRAAYQEKHKNSIGAVDNLGAFYSDINGIVDKGRQGLSLPAQTDFDSAVRRYAAGAKSEMVTWSNGQRTTAITSATNSKLAVTGAAAAAHPDNPEFQSVYQQAVGDAAATLGQLNNWGPDEARAFVQQHIGQVVAGQIHNAVNSADQLKAEQLLRDNIDNMTEPQLTAALGEVKQGQDSYTSTSEAQAWAQGRTLGNANPVTDNYIAAVHGREGSGTNPRSSAKGTGQFLKGTWLDLLKTNPEVAGDVSDKTDQQILALRDNPTIADKAIKTYAQINGAALTVKGFAPTPANLGLAHGFGAAGAETILNAAPTTPVAQILPPEVIAANPYLANQTAGQVRAEFGKRFGAATEEPFSTPSGQIAPPQITNYSDPSKFLADTEVAATSYTDAKYAANPPLGQRVLSSIMGRARLQATALGENQKAAYGDVLGLVLDPNKAVENVDQIPPTLLAKLSPEQFHAIQRDVLANANYITPEKESNILELEGAKQLAAQGFPASFLAKKIDTMVLPPAAKREYMKAQTEARVKAATAAISNAPLKEALASPATKIALSDLGVPTTQTNGQYDPKYEQFVGALSAAVDQATSKTGAAPKGKELDTIVQSVTASTGAKQGWGWFNLGAEKGTPGFEVPEAERQAAVDFYKQTHNGSEPNEAQIAQAYYRKRQRGQ